MSRVPVKPRPDEDREASSRRGDRLYHLQVRVDGGAKAALNRHLQDSTLVAGPWVKSVYVDTDLADLEHLKHEDKPVLTNLLVKRYWESSIPFLTINGKRFNSDPYVLVFHQQQPEPLNVELQEEGDYV